MAELKKRGAFVSPYQLERWRLAGLLPTAERRSLGRGRGFTSRYRDEAVPIAVVLACKTGQGYSTNKAVLDLFGRGFPFPEHAVRAALLWEIDRTERSMRRTKRSGDAAIKRRMSRMRTPAGYHPVLAPFNPEQQLSKATLRNQDERRLNVKRAAGMVADLAIYNEVPPVTSVVEWLRLMGMPDTAERLSTILVANDRGTGLAAHTFTLTRRLAKRAPFPRICAARTVVRMWGFINWASIFGMLGDNAVHTLLRELQNDEEAQLFRSLVGLPVTPSQIAFAILHMAERDELLESSWRKAKELLPVVFGVFTNVMRVNSDYFDDELIWPFARMSELDPEGLRDLAPVERPMDVEALEAMAARALQHAWSYGAPGGAFSNIPSMEERPA